MPEKLYIAIGDIHGELARLTALHHAASAYAAEHHPALEMIFVHLGDLVDRGPDSCGVVEYLMNMHALKPETVTLMGNHEEMMLDSYPNGEAQWEAAWLEWGGRETLKSYSQRDLTHPPKEHLEWIAGLPDVFKDETRNLLFVHAGVHPQHYPDCSAKLHLWSRRRDFFDPARWEAEDLQNMTVVHGHTPTADNSPDLISVEGRTRINVDTGAVYGGQLTAAVLAPDAEIVFLHA